jgi:hypothetical protein
VNTDSGASVEIEWMRIARKDWRRAERNLKDRDSEAAGFFLQQSLEKYLGAILLKNNWRLRKIHEHDALLDEAAKFQGNLLLASPKRRPACNLRRRLALHACYLIAHFDVSGIPKSVLVTRGRVRATRHTR